MSDFRQKMEKAREERHEAELHAIYEAVGILSLVGYILFC